MTRHALLLLFVRLPFFLLACFAVVVCWAVMFVYDQIPKDWIEEDPDAT